MDNILALPSLASKPVNKGTETKQITPCVIKKNFVGSNASNVAHTKTMTYPQTITRKNIVPFSTNPKVVNPQVEQVREVKPLQQLGPDDQIVAAFQPTIYKLKANFLRALKDGFSSRSQTESEGESIVDEDDYVYEPPKRKQYPNFDPKKVRQPENFDSMVLKLYFLDKRVEEPKASRLSRRQNAAPFIPQYETWSKVGHGYLVNPNPPDLFEDPHFVDFYCQCRMKALAIGGEGTAIYGEKDEGAPLLASNARLQYSMIIDEHGIEHLNVEAKMKNAAFKNAKQITIDKLAKLRHSLECKLREYNDDLRNKYRIPPTLPLDHPETAVNYKVPIDQLQFLNYALRMIELTSNLTPKKCTHITKAFTLVLPLLLNAASKPDKQYHFIGKRIHFTYFFRLFHLLNRLNEYFKAIPMIPFHATFGLVKGLRADITTIWQKELHHISDNIEYGGSLSWILCEVRDMSIALTMHLDNVIMIEEAINLYEREKTSDFTFEKKDLLRIACREDCNRRLFAFKFYTDEEGNFSFKTETPDISDFEDTAEFYMSLTSVTPFYPFIISQPNHRPHDEGLPTYVPNNGIFHFDAAFPSTEKFGWPLKVRFEPCSTQSLFSLNTPHDY